MYTLLGCLCLSLLYVPGHAQDETTALPEEFTAEIAVPASVAEGQSFGITCTISGTLESLDSVEFMLGTEHIFTYWNATTFSYGAGYESRLTNVVDAGEYKLWVSDAAYPGDLGAYSCRANLSDGSVVTSSESSIDVVHALSATDPVLKINDAVHTHPHACGGGSPLIVPADSDVDVMCGAHFARPQAGVSIEEPNNVTMFTTGAMTAEVVDNATMTYNSSVQASFSVGERGAVHSVQCNLSHEAGDRSICAEVQVDTVDDCAGPSVPCKNNGTCHDAVGTFTCTCALCFEGATCENAKVRACPEAECSDRGLCRERCEVNGTAEQYPRSCQCNLNYGGDFCENTCDNVNKDASSAPTHRALLGVTVTLTCLRHTGRTISIWWTRDADLARLNEGSETFDAVADDSERAYHCYTEDVADGCTQRQSFLVTGYYELISPNKTITENMTVEEGDDVTLECKVKGSPTPYVRWQHFKTKTENNNSTTIQKWLTNGTANSSTYQLEDVSMDDAGQYICKVTFGGIKSLDVKIIDLVVEEEDDDGLEAWQIALIVIAGVLLLLIIIIIIVYIIFAVVLKKETPKICPSDSAARDGSDPSKAPTDAEKGPVLYPASGAAAKPRTLPPLDVDAEKKKIKEERRSEKYDEEGEYRGEGTPPPADEEGEDPPKKYSDYL